MLSFLASGLFIDPGGHRRWEGGRLHLRLGARVGELNAHATTPTMAVPRRAGVARPCTATGRRPAPDPDDGGVRGASAAAVQADVALPAGLPLVTVRPEGLSGRLVFQSD